LNANPLNQNVGKQRKKELQKNYRNICVTCISSPANRAKITFEMYNLIMDVLLHSLSVHEFKNYPKGKKKNANTGTQTNVVRFRRVLLSCVNWLDYTRYLKEWLCHLIHPWQHS
jgi:hypothetical protein